MSEQKRRDGLTRRGFIKTLGLGGMAATGLAAVSAGEATAAAGKNEGGAASVPRRKLGKTGVEVPVLCLGGMFDTLNNQLLLKQSHNWGVTFWDTAESYGGGMSEEGYGRYIKRNPDARRDLFICSKYKPSPPEKMTEALDAALKRLSTDYVDLYCPHGVSNLKDIDSRIPAWAAEMKKSGKMRFFGFSCHTNMEECLLAAAKTNYVDVILFSYNFRLMHTPGMKEAVAACASAGIGLVAMKTQGGGPVKTDSEAELQMAGRFLQKGLTDKQAKVRAVLEEPNIASICSQMPTLTILSANVSATRDSGAMASEEMDLLRRYAAETRQGYCAGCGRICSEAVSGAVPVSEVMRCLMYYRDYGERDLAREVFAGIPEDVRARLNDVDYGRAEKACPHGLAIAKLMREASEMLA
ncbi:MAG: aldo/keto reductase [Syntrophobacteraceae bacterium]